MSLDAAVVAGGSGISAGSGIDVVTNVAGMEEVTGGLMGTVWMEVTGMSMGTAGLTDLVGDRETDVGTGGVEVEDREIDVVGGGAEDEGVEVTVEVCGLGGDEDAAGNPLVEVEAGVDIEAAGGGDNFSVVGVEVTGVVILTVGEDVDNEGTTCAVVAVVAD